MARMLAALFMAGILVSLGAVGARAHERAHEGEAGEETLAVEPERVAAGVRVIHAGSGLEPESDRVLVLAGPHVTIHFATVRTDAEGMFNQALEIPSHLPSGIYEQRAIGDETLTVSLAVTALVGSGSVASPAPEARETIVARERGPVEWGLLLVVIGVQALAGIALAFRVEAGRTAPTG